MYGYNGKLLEIDLENELIKKIDLGDEIYSKYIGGSGLGSYLLYNEKNKKDVIIYTVGPLTTDSIPNSGRIVVSFISPLTGGYGETHIGTRFAIEFKKSGFDGLIIRGKSNKPSYIYINEKNIEIKDATKYWGMDIKNTINLIRQDLNDKNIKILTIGPAGENKVKFSLIGNEEGFGGRGGSGALMGQKNLKAIVVKGYKNISIAYPNELKKFNIDLTNKLLKGGENLRKYGTAGGVLQYEKIGNLPIKNFSKGIWDEIKVNNISGQNLTKNFLQSPFACTLCPIACKRKVKVKKGKYFDTEFNGLGPEYETIALLGSNLLIDDLEAIIKMNELCDSYGLDTISTGNVIGFIFELAEKNLISKRVDGIDLEWGNINSVFRLIEKIAYRDGVGNILANGVRELSKKFGGKEFAMKVKGLELPAHDGRAYFSHALSFATMNRGGDHLGWTHMPYRGYSVPELNINSSENRYEDDENMIIKVVKMQNLMIIYDSLVICKYAFTAGLTLNDILKLIYYVTGKNYTYDMLMDIANEIWLMQRKINIEMGINKEEDRLPSRMLSNHLDRNDTKIPPLEKWLPYYYTLRKL